ncbi:peptide deformylase [Chloroflexota bacterium]
MAVQPIRVVPDPILRQKAKRVSFFNSSIRRLVDDMLETMHSVGGVGLAAPQVGIPLRVLVISMPGEDDVVLINPQIVRRSGERLVNEGCLSLPGYIGQVKHAAKLTVKGRDCNGKETRIKAEELLAQALEHEIDHLNGVLYIDRLVGMTEPHKIEPEEAQL